MTTNSPKLYLYYNWHSSIAFELKGRKCIGCLFYRMRYIFLDSIQDSHTCKCGDEFNSIDAFVSHKIQCKNPLKKKQQKTKNKTQVVSERTNVRLEYKTKHVHS